MSFIVFIALPIPLPCRFNQVWTRWTARTRVHHGGTEEDVFGAMRISAGPAGDLIVGAGLVPARGPPRGRPLQLFRSRLYPAAMAREITMRWMSLEPS